MATTTKTIDSLMPNSSSSLSPRLLDHVLSVMWLFLCTSLVSRKPHYIHVFYSFAVSWLVAGILLLLLRRLNKQRNTSSTFHASHRNAVTVQHGIAVIALSISLFVQTSSSPSHCYSILAGYLAFDHWFVALKKLHKPLRRTVQDAVTLTCSVILLANLTTERATSTSSSTTTVTADYQDNAWLVVAAYLVYDLVQHWQSLWLHLEANASPTIKCFDDESIDSATSCNVSAPSPSILADKLLATKDTNGKPVSDSNNNNTWIIHGVAYRLDDYVDKHPGGKEAILLGQSRDCTALFESYHPFSKSHVQVLNKYRVDKNSTLASENDTVPPRDEFYATLAQKVQAKLRCHHIDPMRDRVATTQRTLYYGVVALCVIVCGYAHCKGSIWGSFLFAVFGWLLGALGHDAGHYCVSHVPWINDAGVWAMSLLCNPMLWQHQHTYAHHSHTNDFYKDPDMHHFETLLRVHRRFQRKNIHSWQQHWLYVMFAYMFVVFGTCFYIPWGMLQDGASLYGMVQWTDKSRPLRYFGFVAHVIAYVGIIMVLPYFVHATWLSAWAAVTVHVSTSGLIFAIFSQINHLNEASLDLSEKQDFSSDPKRQKLLAESWAAQQIETSNNFASQSTLWHFLSNGLNYQIEHHLFPGLNHCHLHLIAPVVKETCKEFGVTYKCYDTWSEIMQATLDWLHQLAIEEDAQEAASAIKID
ncbi:hypothetical protein MPSEU_000596300 [Mayamaea pseudoterrestris]|nr:hypothetical protein MPSEU_000596300 [Mayamaea pseudoterrestris]